MMRFFETFVATIIGAIFAALFTGAVATHYMVKNATCLGPDRRACVMYFDRLYPIEWRKL